MFGFSRHPSYLAAFLKFDSCDPRYHNGIKFDYVTNSATHSLVNFGLPHKICKTKLYHANSQSNATARRRLQIGAECREQTVKLDWGPDTV
jgi:hypothetical protein